MGIKKPIKKYQFNDIELCLKQDIGREYFELRLNFPSVKSFINNGDVLLKAGKIIDVRANCNGNQESGYQSLEKDLLFANDVIEVGIENSAEYKRQVAEIEHYGTLGDSFKKNKEKLIQKIIPEMQEKLTNVDYHIDSPVGLLDAMLLFQKELI